MASGTVQILVHTILTVINGSAEFPSDAGLEGIIHHHLSCHHHQPLKTRIEKDHIHILFFLNPDKPLTPSIDTLMHEIHRKVNLHRKGKRIFINPVFYVVSHDSYPLETQVERFQNPVRWGAGEETAVLEQMLETSLLAEKHSS